MLPCLLAFAALVQFAFEVFGGKPAPLWAWSAAGYRHQLADFRNAAAFPAGSPETSTELASTVLMAQPWSPRRWADVAEFHETSGNLALADRFFQQAVDLAGPMPLVWIRKANFHWRQGDTARALEAYRNALAVPSPYQPAIYVALDGLQQPPETLFSEVLSTSRDAAAGYLRHRRRNSRLQDMPTLWNLFVAKHGTDHTLAAEVSMALWRTGRHEEAHDAWLRAGDAAERTAFALESPGFAGLWLPSPFAWRCEGCGEVQLNRPADSPEQLALIFPPQLNRRFDGLRRSIALPPGSYELRFRWKKSGDGRREGARFLVRDAINRNLILARSADLLQSEDWREESLPFSLQQRTFVELSVVREPFRRLPLSEKSSLWLESPSLTPRLVSARQGASPGYQQPTR